MRIPDDKIDEIQSLLDIVDVVSDYVPLKKKGANFFGLCPFHNEKTPSFSVNPERGIYKCFGCGKGGNVFNFVMEVERLGFVEVVKLLAERAGVDLPEQAGEGSDTTSELEPIYHALRVAGRFFHSQLTESDAGAVARDYLDGRSFSASTIKKFGIGYAPDTWDALLEHAKSEQVAAEYLEKAGLVIPRDKGEGHYDRFRNRVMFPLFSHVGQVVGFTGRVLESDAKQAKYVNTPETAVYHKGRILYGLNLSKNEIRRAEEAILVEGNTDVVQLFQSGITNVVATSGTALTSAQVGLLSRYTDTAVLLFDSDEAGKRATSRSIDLMLQAGMRIYVLTLPEDYDPDSFVSAQGREGFLDYSQTNRTDFVSFKLRAGGYRRDSGDPEADWEVIQSVLSSIRLIPNAVRREGYLRLVSDQTGMPEGTLHAELKKLMRRSDRRSEKRSSPSSATGTRSGESSSTIGGGDRSDAGQPLAGERDLVRLMILHGDRMIAYVLANMSLDEFTPGPARKSVEILLEMYQKGEVDTGSLLSTEADSDIREFAAGLMIQRDAPSPNWQSIHDIEVPPLDANAKRSATDAMRRLKLQRVDQAIAAQNRQIADESDEARSALLLADLRALQKLRKEVQLQTFVEWTG